MSFGENIKNLRLESGKTQKEFAQMLDISKSYMSELESNKRNPSIETVNKIAKKLNVSSVYLLYGKKAVFSDNKNELESENFNAKKFFEEKILDKDGNLSEESENERINSILKKIARISNGLTFYNTYQLKLLESSLDYIERIEIKGEKNNENIQNLTEQLNRLVILSQQSVTRKERIEKLTKDLKKINTELNLEINEIPYKDDEKNNQSK
ncbi:helix-turn-helix transcriptional regulator [Tetragenococcus halophilus]